MNSDLQNKQRAETIELSDDTLRSHNLLKADARIMELVKLLARQAAQEDFRAASTPSQNRLH